MYSLHLSAEQTEIRDTVRDFVEREVKPKALKADRLDINDRSLLLDVLDQASRMGLRTLALPEELGGAGADNLTCCLVTEELAAGDVDLAAVLGHTAALSRVLSAAMSDAQRERFLTAFVSDDRYHLALAEHEPDAETALGLNYHRAESGRPQPKTAAERRGDSYVINGAKHLVANAPLAKLFAVQVMAPAGVSTLLIERATPGLTVREHGRGERWFHGANGTVEFAGCEVPVANLLGREGESPFADAAGSGRGFPLAGALNLGIGRAAFEAALEYAQLRVQGGRPIVQHQAIGTKLADVAIRLEAVRGMIWQAAWASDHPDAIADGSLQDQPLTAMAEVFAAEAVYRAVKDSAECFGAMGVMRDMPLQKYVRDALTCLHAGEGATEARLRIAEALSGHRRAFRIAAE